VNTLILALVASCLFAAALSPAAELQATSADGTKLAGSLHLPDGSGPFPVVVFIHGSEPGQRGNAAYLRWADAFLVRGIGALAFDKRGCGDSEGTYVEAPDLEVPATDVLAWVELLSARDDVSSIGVLGWSQGGWIGPLVASKSDQVEFVVSISGPGVSPLEQNIYDKTNQCAASGATAAQVAMFERTIRLVWTYLVTGEDQAEAKALWDLVVDEEWFQRAYQGPPMMDRDRVLQDPRMTQYVAHSGYDPVPVLEILEVPMLAVFGERDTIVPVEASMEAMRQAFATGGGGRLTIVVVPGGDHGLRVGGAGLAKGYPDRVVEWVQQQVIGE